MKFNCGPTYEEWRTKREKWHKWFAWYPVRVNSHDCRWLETVLRKGILKGGYDPSWEWEYKSK